MDPNHENESSSAPEGAKDGRFSRLRSAIKERAPLFSGKEVGRLQHQLDVAEQEIVSLRLKNEQLEVELATLRSRHEIVGLVDPGSPPTSSSDSIEGIIRAEAEGQRQHDVNLQEEAARDRLSEFIIDTHKKIGEIGIGFAAIPGNLDATQIEKVGRVFKKLRGKWRSATPKRMGRHDIGYASEIDFQRITTPSGLEDVRVEAVRTHPYVSQMPDIHLPTMEVRFAESKDLLGNIVPQARQIEFIFPEGLGLTKTKSVDPHSVHEYEYIHHNLIQNMEKVIGKDNVLLDFFNQPQIKEFIQNSNHERRVGIEIDSDPGKLFAANIYLFDKFSSIKNQHRFILQSGGEVTRRDGSYKEISHEENENNMVSLDQDEFIAIGRAFFQAVESYTPFTYSRQAA